MPKKKNKRVDLDVRPVGPFTKNYDYGEPGLGTSIYRGPMDRFKSVKDFLEKSRKQRQKRKRKLLSFLIGELNKKAGEVIPYATFQKKQMERDLDLRKIFPPEAFHSWKVGAFYPDRIAATLLKDEERIASFDISYLIEEGSNLTVQVRIWDKVNGSTLGFIPAKDLEIIVPKLDILIQKLHWLLG